MQVLHAIMDNPDDTTQVSVVFANRGEEDILERVRPQLLNAFKKRTMVVVVVGARCVWNV